MINRLFILICFTYSMQLNAVAQNSVKILQYNVLKGFQGDTSLIGRYRTWLTTTKPDIIIYQELNDFTRQSFEGFAASYGHPYAVISKETGYAVGISSRHPIKNVERILDNMWHGYIYAYVSGMHVFAVHFAPFDEKVRRSEVATILSRAALLPVSEGVIIAGDLNAIARTDDSVYKKQNEAITGYNETVGPEHQKRKRKLSYYVTDTLINTGFSDTYRQLHHAYKSSIPTRAYQMPGKFSSRIDYIWINKVLAYKLISSDIIHDEITDVVSDHYPNLVEIKY